MDHISKALEKAETEHGSVRNWIQPSADRPDVNAVPITQGQKLELDINLLREHHILSGPGHEEARIADKYRLLRTRILQLMKPKNWTTLGITSTSPKAGKSLTAINLAITLARDPDRKVVLVDADLRKPSISSDMGFDAKFGLIDYLTSEIELEEVFVQPVGFQNLSILPGRRDDLAKLTPELLNSNKMRGLMDSLNTGDSSSIVIVDLPPLLIGDDVIVQTSHLQSVLLVIEEGGTNVDELRECAELLTDLNLLGTILNKSTEQAKEFEGYYQIGTGT